VTRRIIGKVLLIAALLGVLLLFGSTEVEFVYSRF
jgi:hypothetical protein